MKIVTILLLALVSFGATCADDGDDHDDDDNYDASADGVVCQLTPEEMMAVAPLLSALGLTMTVGGVRKLIEYLNTASGGILLSPAVVGMEGLTSVLNRLVVALIGRPLDLDNIVKNLADIVNKTLGCVGGLLN